jgi:RNA polymerase sigma factor (sigma-70 family)
MSILSVPMPADFPSTRWSRILAPSGGRDLDAIARLYWRPIQAWFRARLRCGDDAAADLAQDAFAWLLSRDVLDQADPARGRFRAFLKTALARFAIEQARRRGALKRGGGVSIASFEEVGEPADAAAAPDRALDEAWRHELLERAHAALRAELEASGRATYYLLFRDYYFAEAAPPSHAELATRHGCSKTDVSNWLDYAKRRYRALLHAEVAETVRSEAELEDELRWLFGAEGPT